MAAKASKPFTYTSYDAAGRLVTRSLSKADLSKAIEAVLRPERERKAFFESPDFNTLIDQFRAATRRGPVDQEDVVYAHRRFSFTADHFRQAFESVMDHAPGETRCDTVGGGFTRLTKTYRGLDFSALIGQGSAYSIMRSSSPEMKPA